MSFYDWCISNNKKELSNVLKKSLIIIGSISVIMLVLGEGLSTPIALIFANGKEEMIELTTIAMRLWSISFLFSGLAFYGAAFFVGLNNGLIALLMAVTRSVILSILFVFTLPIAMGPNGIWLTPMCHEAGGAVLALVLIYVYRKKYGYQIFKHN